MRSRTRPLRLLLAALALASCAAAPAPEPRAQRSANLSHITGTSRKIQMVLKNHYLQLMPDGTVNGTIDGTSVYTILQRASTGPNKSGLLTIQGVSTCLYLCMDACGFQYAHKDLSDDCMFEEHIEENHYNTYSRIRNGKKTFLALANNGKARRTQIPITREHLGNLSGYALTVTSPARWGGQTHCPPRRHRGKMKRPPPRHRNCMLRVQKQNSRHKRKHKKANGPKKKRHPKPRRKHENGTTTTTEVTWDESTMSTMSTTTDAEFFRSATALEAVGRA